jgi:four helix bundle protein
LCCSRRQESGGKEKKEEGELNKSQRFQDLLVWQKAHQFVLALYNYTGAFPAREIYGLANQFRRSAISIPANIAEGFKKRSKADKARYFNIAQGSLEETRYYLILSNDLGYGDSTELMILIEEVSKLLNAYTKAMLSSVC